MRRTLVSLVGAALICGASLTTLFAQETVREPASGVKFPTRLAVPGGGEQVLTGTGLRTRTFMQVKVYAFGLYVDPDGAKAALAGFAGKDAKTLQKDQSFYDAVIMHTFPATLRLVMTRDVDGETMAEAFDGALRPRVQQAAAEMNMPGGEDALTTFHGYFNVEEMTKTSELLFSCSPDGVLASRVKGVDKAAITSPALCWALFDVYLGKTPISGDGKKSVIARFPALLGGM